MLTAAARWRVRARSVYPGQEARREHETALGDPASGCRRAGLYSACEGLCFTAFDRKEFVLSIIRAPNPTVSQQTREGRWFTAFLSFSLKDPCYIHFQFIVFHPILC